MHSSIQQQKPPELALHFCAVGSNVNNNQVLSHFCADGSNVNNNHVLSHPRALDTREKEDIDFVGFGGPGCTPHQGSN